MNYPQDFKTASVEHPATQQEIQDLINSAIQSGNNHVHTVKNVAVIVVGFRVYVAHDYDYADITKHGV